MLGDEGMQVHCIYVGRAASLREGKVQEEDGLESMVEGDPSHIQSGEVS